MATDVQNQQGPNLTTLVSGIISDAQRLIREEIALARSEMRQEVNKAKTAVVSLAAGGLVAFIGCFLLAFGLVHLLHWATGAADPAAEPLWAWFLIVGAVITSVGGALLFRGMTQVSEIQVPPPQTTQALKEIL